MPGFTSNDFTHATRLLGTAALNCKAGVINIGAGAVRDTLLCGVIIQLNAAAVTLTITGLGDSANPPAAASMLLTGQITSDYIWVPSFPLLNEFAAFTFQPSVASKVWVFTRAYTGP